MGAQGGLKGKRVAERIANGSWATTLYQCRHNPLPGNSNWFSVADFVDSLRAAGVDVRALAPSPEDALTEAPATSVSGVP
jgi:hypothetical protein